MIAGGQFTGSYFNVPALLVIMALTWILVRGVRESARANNVMVMIKIVAILVFVFAAAGAVKPANWHPFMPNGFLGCSDGRSDRVLHLHRIRFGLDGRGRVPSAAARSAVRHPDDLAGLHGSLRECLAGAHGVANWKTLCQRCARGDGAEGPRV